MGCKPRPATDLDAAIEDCRASDEVARLRLAGWPSFGRRLILRLRPTGDTSALQMPLGAGVVAGVAVDLDHGIVVIGASQLSASGRSQVDVMAMARANTITQPFHRLTTDVVDGPDRGARITVLVGGAGIGGLVVDLHQLVGGAAAAETLVVVPNDHVMGLGRTAPGAGAEARQALAARLARLGRTGVTVSTRSALPPLGVFRFREPGRLAMFGAKDP